MLYQGDYVEDATVYIMFNTFTSDDPSASSTITNLLNTDVHIHKDNGLTQRNNAAGITVSVDFDGITGSHLIAIDTSDDTVADFWVTGSDYFVRIEGTTIDAATINAVVGHFSIQNRYMRGTDSAATAVVLGAAVGASISADIAAVKAQTVAIEADTDVIDDATSGLVKIASDVAAVLVDTSTTLQGELDAIQAAVITNAAGVDIAADIIALKAETVLIVADTNELQTDWANGGRLDLIQDIIAADTTTDIPALIAALPDAAAINAEVVDALGTDAIAELAQGIPTATPTIKQALMLPYMALRNESLTTATLLSIKNDAGTVITKSTLSDDATTMTKGKLASGA